MIENFLQETLPDVKNFFVKFHEKELEERDYFTRQQFAVFCYKTPPKLDPDCHLSSSEEAVISDGLITSPVLRKRKKHAESAVVNKAKEFGV